MSVDQYQILERGILAALESYSNVHRGSGHKSVVTTYLFEEARNLILEELGLNKRGYTVIFTTPLGYAYLKKEIGTAEIQILSSDDLGLPLGVRAVIVRKRKLPKGAPVISGGGTTRLISREWVIWAGAPARFEAGTPSVINIIAFARGLRITGLHGKGVFTGQTGFNRKSGKILEDDPFPGLRGKALLQKLRNTRIGSDWKVKTVSGERPYINLDSSASTPTFEPVWNAYRNTLIHPKEVQQEIVGEVRNLCARFLGAPGDEYTLFFTANSTEAIHLAAENIRRMVKGEPETVIVGSDLEHSSNDLPWRAIPGSAQLRIPADNNGFPDLDALERLLEAYNGSGIHGQKRIRLVALTGASNVLGVSVPLQKVCRLVHRYGARLLVDAAQLAPHRAIDMKATGIDYLALSAHKAYAPFGGGILAVSTPLVRFDASEMHEIFRYGEENAAGIAAMGKALDLLMRIGMDVVEGEERTLTEKALQGLSSLENVRLFGISDPETPEAIEKMGVIPFNLKNIVSFRVGKELAARKGIGVRVGCHCAHITVKHILNVGPGLERFQRILQTLIPAIQFPGVVRVSLGIENTEEDIDRLIEGLQEILNGHGKQRARETSRDRPVPGKKELNRVMKQLDQLALSRVEEVFGHLT